MTDETTWLARAFKALGDPTRLRIFRYLASECCTAAVDQEDNERPTPGSTVGEVCCSVTGEDHITSTVSHHVKELRQAGLIFVERSGRRMICSPNRDAIARLGKFLNMIGENNYVCDPCSSE